MDLLTSRLKIREFTPADYAALRSMETSPGFNTYERPIPLEEDTRRSLEESITTQRENPRLVFRMAIARLDRPEIAIGIIKLSRQQEAIREWEVGWAIHPLDWGQGYATEAARALMGWGFAQLNIHRIVAFCHADNRASTGVMQKLGMHQDGRLRETKWLNGVWWDELVYAVLEREWIND